MHFLYALSFSAVTLYHLYNVDHADFPFVMLRQSTLQNSVLLFYPLVEWMRAVADVDSLLSLTINYKFCTSCYSDVSAGMWCDGMAGFKFH